MLENSPDTADSTATDPTSGLDRLRRLIPYLYGQKVTTGKKMGRGVILIVAVATPNVDVTLTHNLGRVPQIMPELLDNGTTYTPKRKRGTAAWTINTVTLQYDTAGTYTEWVR